MYQRENGGFSVLIQKMSMAAMAQFNCDENEREYLSGEKGNKSGNEGWFMELLLLVLKISIHRFLKKKINKKTDAMKNNRNKGRVWLMHEKELIGEAKVDSRNCCYFENIVDWT